MRRCKADAVPRTLNRVQKGEQTPGMASRILCARNELREVWKSIQPAIHFVPLNNLMMLFRYTDSLPPDRCLRKRLLSQQLRHAWPTRLMGGFGNMAQTAFIRIDSVPCDPQSTLARPAGTGKSAHPTRASILPFTRGMAARLKLIGNRVTVRAALVGHVNSLEGTPRSWRRRRLRRRK